LFKAANEELAKSEAGKQMPSPKEGGNGTTPGGSAAKSDAGNGPRSAALKDGGSLGGESGVAPEGPRSAAYAKKEASMGAPSAGKIYKGEESPVAKDASDESAPPKKDDASPSPDSGSAPPDASASPSPDASASPPPDAPPDAPPAGPGAEGAPQGDPAMDAGMGDDQALVQAYGQLDDNALKAHYTAFMQVVMQRMSQGSQGAGAPGGMPGADPMAAGGPPAGAPPALPPADPSAAGGVPPPAMKAAPSMAPPPQPMMRSEASGKEESLNKAEVKIGNLEKQVEGLTQLLESMLTKPERKAVTSMAEYIAKSEGDKPSQKKLSGNDIRTKLGQVAKSPDLKKSDQDLITRYFLDGNVSVNEIEHLLK
jgi:hypothetical protein